MQGEVGGQGKSQCIRCSVFLLVISIRLWLDEDVGLTIKPLKAFLSLMR